MRINFPSYISSRNRMKASTVVSGSSNAPSPKSSHERSLYNHYFLPTLIVLRIFVVPLVLVVDLHPESCVFCLPLYVRLFRIYVSRKLPVVFNGRLFLVIADVLPDRELELWWQSLLSNGPPRRPSNRLRGWYHTWWGETQGLSMERNNRRGEI